MNTHPGGIAKIGSGVYGGRWRGFEGGGVWEVAGDGRWRGCGRWWRVESFASIEEHFTASTLRPEYITYTLHYTAHTLQTVHDMHTVVYYIYTTVRVRNVHTVVQCVHTATTINSGFIVMHSLSFSLPCSNTHFLLVPEPRFFSS